MRCHLAIVLFVCVPALAQSPAVGYKIDFDPSRDVKLLDQSSSGKAGLYVKVNFGITVDNTIPETSRLQPAW